MSACVAQQNAQHYVGTLNGVMYRIRPGNLAPGAAMFALEPFETPAPASPGPARPASVSPAPGEADGEPTRAQALAEPEAPATTLFKRDGAEPLRAGHPDLWDLLVRGTCLEGTTYKAAASI